MHAHAARESFRLAPTCIAPHAECGMDGARRIPFFNPCPPNLQAVKRWFEDTYQEATRGDVKQQALLGQMYAEGYGCEKDPKAAKEWADRAVTRGYRMQGVYCEL